MRKVFDIVLGLVDVVTGLAWFNILVRPPPPAKSVFGIHHPKGLSYLTQLSVGLSKLNFHKFKHNFRDTINPMCPTSDGIEDTEHFLLFCSSFDVQRQDLLPRIVELLRPVQIADPSNDALTHLLLYGDHDLYNDLNRSILELTLHFIHEACRKQNVGKKSIRLSKATFNSYFANKKH